jgi:hypothetical protein
MDDRNVIERRDMEIRAIQSRPQLACGMWHRALFDDPKYAFKKMGWAVTLAISLWYLILAGF